MSVNQSRTEGKKKENWKEKYRETNQNRKGEIRVCAIEAAREREGGGREGAGTLTVCHTHSSFPFCLFLKSSKRSGSN